MNKIQSYTFAKALKEAASIHKKSNSKASAGLATTISKHKGDSKSMIRDISNVVSKHLSETKLWDKKDTKVAYIELIIIKFLCTYILSERDMSDNTYQSSILSPFTSQPGDEDESK